MALAALPAAHLKMFELQQHISDATAVPRDLRVFSSKN